MNFDDEKWMKTLGLNGDSTVGKVVGQIWIDWDFTSKDWDFTMFHMMNWDEEPWDFMNFMVNRLGFNKHGELNDGHIAIDNILLTISI